MNFTNASELLELCNDKKISEVMLNREIELFSLTKEEIISQMKKTYEVMKKSAKTRPNGKTMGGLIGGESQKLSEFKGKSACDGILKKALEYSLNVPEVNATMGLIVASPTAGSCGVLPAGVIAVCEHYNLSDEDAINALFNASAIGYLASRNATVSGAEGGCQAEVGTASAMTASAICELLGGTPKMCLDSASTALANLLGLVCDPISGLVEAPCNKRNSIGVSNALISAQMSLAGIEHILSLDEMIDVMYKVGKSIPSDLRETAQGGMAKAPSACNLCKY